MAFVPKLAVHTQNRLLAALEPVDLKRIEPHLEIVELPRGHIIYEAGQTVVDAYFPHDCVVSLLAVLSDGATAEVSVFGCEGVLGMLSALVTRETFGRYVVQVPGTCSRIPINRAEEFFNQSAACRLLFRRYVEALLAQTFQSVACNARHSVEARCCRLILSTQDRVNRDTLPLTHEFLADMLGVQRPTVSHVTRKLQTEGFIKQGRGELTITDRAGLEKLSCECYGAIHRIFERVLPRTHEPRQPVCMHADTDRDHDSRQRKLLESGS